MAKQRGAIILDGRIGGISFYSTRHGNMARGIPEISKERYQNDPKLAGRRDAASEFGYASTMSKLLRLGVHQCMPDIAEGGTHAQLTAAIREAVKGDKDHMRGKRRITGDSAPGLVGFNWREVDVVGAVLRASHKVMLDVAAGSVTLDMSGLVPVRDLKLTEGATHAEIYLLLVGVDYEGDQHVSVCALSGKMDVKGTAVTPVSLTCALPAGAGGILMAGVGVEAYQLSNGVYYRLNDGAAFEIGAVGAIN